MIRGTHGTQSSWRVEYRRNGDWLLPARQIKKTEDHEPLTPAA